MHLLNLGKRVKVKMKTCLEMHMGLRQKVDKDKKALFQTPIKSFMNNMMEASPASMENACITSVSSTSLQSSQPPKELNMSSNLFNMNMERLHVCHQLNMQIDLLTLWIKPFNEKNQCKYPFTLLNNYRKLICNIWKNKCK
jgi:hypothetical protein